jgi:hypothetical protein
MDINMSVKCSCLSHAIATYTLLKSGMSLYFMTTYTHLSFPEPLIKHHHSFSEVNSLILIGYWRNPYNSPLRHILWHQSLLIIRVLHICLSCWPFNCSPNSITHTHTHTHTFGFPNKLPSWQTATKIDSYGSQYGTLKDMQQTYSSIRDKKTD